MTGPCVLIVDDEPPIRRLLRTSLNAQDYRTVEAATAAEALASIAADKPDVVILDLGLPDRDGLEVIRAVRPVSAVPIVVLTSREAERAKVAALDLGADDYVTKPFSVRELLARAEVLLRRRRQKERAVYQFGPFELDAASRRLLRGGKEVELTPKECDLLLFLVRQAGRALTRDEILKNVWGHGVFVTGRSVDRCINTLRNKIERHPARPSFITTIREIGYRFEGGGD